MDMNREGGAGVKAEGLRQTNIDRERKRQRQKERLVDLKTGTHTKRAHLLRETSTET